MPESVDQSRRELLTAVEAALTDRGVTREFVEHYHRHVATEDLAARGPEDLAHAIAAHVALARQRPQGRAVVSVTTTDSGRTSLIQIVTDDMPFLVDSVSAAVDAAGHPIALIIHPLVPVRRDASGTLEVILEGEGGIGFGEGNESWISLETAPLGEDTAELTARLQSVLEDVRGAVEDWPRMASLARGLAKDLAPLAEHDEEAAETATFLEWLVDNHFTFLGHRQFRQSEDGGLAPVQSTGLGLSRSDPTQDEIAEARHDALTDVGRRLHISKGNHRSTVHRDAYLDEVAIRLLDDRGAVIGEHRFSGLFTQSTYTDSVLDMPVIRRKVAQVLDRAGLTAESHGGKDLIGVLTTYPRDELFQADVDALEAVATTVVHLKSRRATRLFLRRTDGGRAMSCLVYIPRDRYNTTVRTQMSEILKEAFGGESVHFTARVSESVLARLHFLVRRAGGESIPEITPEETAKVEERLIETTRTWEERLARTANEAVGEERTRSFIDEFGAAFPPVYQQHFSTRQTVADLKNLTRLGEKETTRQALYKPKEGAEAIRRFKVFRLEPLSLTTVLPIFTDMGVEVVDEQPYPIERADGRSMYVYDFGFRAADPEMWLTMPHEGLRELFEGAVGAVFNGAAESDGFNQLVLRAGMTWRHVVILRTIAKYLRQVRATFSQGYVESALVNNEGIARHLVDLFEVRFDPDRYDGEAGGERADHEAAIVATINAALEQVSSLDEDRIIRAFLGVIQATLRTNFYQRDADGNPRASVALKLEPAKVPDMPSPRPAFEIWVYSPRVEGVHLRFGPVARGGLRWSDRREDFRTEILGLVKAQMVKNAVIVPTGSKGGFFAKQLPDPSVDRDAWLTEGKAAYTDFIASLLDVTDNRIGAEIVPPERVVRHDGDDSYLVVAADKGTASFSDIANGVSGDYGFWLDDAFASGGSVGYDHKAMGITARGAWESVKRHFRELGIDTQSQEFTVAGVGDMSGDVFGNGMLLSEHIRLVAAFDHRHIFIDPTPDAAASYAERRRLFDLPRSSWADYDESLISEGGGVFARTLKSIPVTPQMVTALGLDEGTTKLTPAEMLTAILKAPVDLLWNGGIGTYVKASSESHAEVGDRANDGIRVDGQDLRATVVGEGGNLGATQLGRIEAALNGVRINTDAIDNSAGVDTSDHEVNIKILLGSMVRAGELDTEARNELLASMTDEVAVQVLRDNYEQNVLLGNARAQELRMVPVHQRLMHWLEGRGDLDRALEFLPSDALLERRRKEGVGLKSPEFSVLVAYAKLALKEDLAQSALPDDPWFGDTLAGYFPEPVRERGGEHLAEHPLRREIVINSVANAIVNRGGITFAYRALEETGASTESVARAFLISREVFALGDFVREVEALDNVVSTDVQTEMYLEFRRLLDRSTRWFLTSRPGQLDIPAEVDRFSAVVRELTPKIPDMLRGSERERLQTNAAKLSEKGVDEALALRSAALLDSFSLLDVVDIATDTGEEPAAVAQLYYVVSEDFGIDRLLASVSDLPREDRWDGLARGALRDDLYAVLEGITRSVIEAAPAQSGQDAAARYEAWQGANGESLQRVRTSLSGIEGLDAPNIAAISVALRTLRSVVRSGSSA
ncbi:NAD-glutamate dehydrogenase [Janibacter sp. G56]|uniref:NAD-glutamate dehydrogenase n=1 Tax=Janibacter sp. G56 TaxID=3418717 RepID=UPI003CFE4F56